MTVMLLHYALAVLMNNVQSVTLLHTAQAILTDRYQNKPECVSVVSNIHKHLLMPDLWMLRLHSAPPSLPYLMHVLVVHDALCLNNIIYGA